MKFNLIFLHRCVLGMDHHCIWINQCVGAHNHRHFFLFIAYLTFASFLIVVAGHNTAYDHIFEVSQIQKKKVIEVRKVLVLDV